MDTLIWLVLLLFLFPTQNTQLHCIFAVDHSDHNSSKQKRTEHDYDSCRYEPHECMQLSKTKLKSRQLSIIDPV